MTEGEIPDYLRESVPSAEAYKQEARRDYQIVKKAWSMGIPEESLANGTVHRYVGVVRDLEAATEGSIWPRREELEAPEGSAREDREQQIRALYYTARVILEDGLQHGSDHSPIVRSELKHVFDDLARRYGGRIEYDNDWEEPDAKPVSGLWTGRPEHDSMPAAPWRADNQDSVWWDRPQIPGERHDREHLAQLAEEATRQGLRPDAAQTDPMAHGLLMGLLYARRLEADTTALEDLPDAPGLRPEAKERLTRIAPLTRLAVEVLEEEFHPGRLSPSRVSGELLEVGRAYGLKVRSR